MMDRSPRRPGEARSVQVIRLRVGDDAMLTDECLGTATTQLSRAGRDGVGAVVFAADGQDWCAGREPSVGDGGDLVDDQLLSLLRSLEETPVLTVGALTGRVAGAGLVLALAMDIRVGSREVTLEARDLGGHPAPGIAASLAWFLGRGRATRSVLTGASFSASEAEHLGLADQVEEPLEGAATELAEHILEIATVSARDLRRTLRAHRELPLAEALRFECMLGAAR